MFEHWNVVVNKTSEKKRRTREKKVSKRMMEAQARNEKGSKSLSILGVVEPLGVNGLDKAGEWEELNRVVDSGAGETVIEEDALGCVAVIEGEARRKGVKYEVADGTLIDNKGKRGLWRSQKRGRRRNWLHKFVE